MISLNTNFSSLIAQSSLKNSTNILNQAVERMTTGYKINHAKDNAANYSISTNMTTQLNAYDVAADNVAMGMDLVTTANDTVSLMQDKAQRLKALCIQARNGTFGAQSLAAINAEAGALINEITRLYMTSEYNGVSLFNRQEYTIAPHLPQAKAEYNGFIADPKTYTDSEVEAMTSISEVTDSFTKSQYKISSAEELAKLAELTNDGIDTSGVTFVLAKDIDLAQWCADHADEGGWTPIGDYGNDTNLTFKGVFNGNGHKIKNLIINRESSYQGLFGRFSGGSILNLCVESININARHYLGAIVGCALSTKIHNCSSQGNIQSSVTEGQSIGAIGNLTSNAELIDSYSTANVAGYHRVGSLCGTISEGTDVINCFATGNVNGDNEIGGLIGLNYRGTILNSYSTGDVQGVDKVGGLVGFFSKPDSTYESSIENCNSYGIVNGIEENSKGSFVGAICITKDNVNFEPITISNCQSVAKDINNIGGSFQYQSGGGYTLIPDYDMSDLWGSIDNIEFKNVTTTLQVGTNGDSTCQIDFDTNFEINLSGINGGIETVEAFNSINDFLNLLSEKSTQLGAVQNRLESALDSIEVNINNLTSSRSTIRDADIANESASYIQQQILQEAAATLLATANQSPAIALQLI